MPFSTIADRQASHYDMLTVVRPMTAAAVAATTSETAIAFPITKVENCVMVLQLQAVTGFVAGTATWSFDVEVATALAGPFTKVGTVTPASGAAQDLMVPVLGYAVSKLLPNASFVRVSATKTGTVGNLSYAAYLSPDLA
jgi:hypothetical protein